ncbi:hypothetical protein V5799_003467 [Amblyomma americanum]|uniref:Uncharacterized protein n=1 Tax=Amblyomma americanum TaxID=6943 RepID=A0AAQ4D8W6_AMBAM
MIRRLRLSEPSRKSCLLQLSLFAVINGARQRIEASSVQIAAMSLSSRGSPLLETGTSASESQLSRSLCRLAFPNYTRQLDLLFRESDVAPSDLAYCPAVTAACHHYRPFLLRVALVLERNQNTCRIQNTLDADTWSSGVSNPSLCFGGAVLSAMHCPGDDLRGETS